MNDSPARDAQHRVWRTCMERGLTAALGAAWCLAALLWPGSVAWAQAAAPLAVAFHYGANPPLDDLKAFDIAVIEPDHVPDPRPYRRAAADGASELFAYVSFGEVLPSRAYFKNIPQAILKGENRDWGSSVVDQTAPGWPTFLIESILAPLWQRGYRGFFFDTLDSYHLIATTPAARAAQETAMVATLRAVRARFPGVRMIFNRGFEILPQVREMVTAVAAESLYRGWDQAKKQYREVPAADREWLLGQLQTARDSFGLPVIAIDYVAPAERVLARETARRILALGFSPWVANPELDMLGVGRVEVLPRRVLVLAERPQDSADFHTSTAQRFLGMPLNHLGYTYEFLDPRTEPLPGQTLRGRYAGIVTWQASGRPEVDARVASFLQRQIADGVRVAAFNQMPFPIDAASARRLGLEIPPAPAAGRVAVVLRDPMIGLEREPLPNRRSLVALRVGPAGRSLMRLADSAGNLYDAAAITPWGGYVLEPFNYTAIEGRDQNRWVVNPLEFLKAALARDQLPVPDVTTEAGRRMLIVHVDGDGWASRAEMPGGPYASDVLAKELLERFRVPTTVSVIQGEIASDGLYPTQATALEAIARRIYRMPNVEAASHSYSHPFDWSRVDAPAVPGESAYHLAIPGYRFDLQREIAGSIAYIDRTLVPADKPARVFLWTGNCVPLQATLGAVQGAGILNMNGGDTLISRSFPSWTAIAAQGIRKGPWYQVFAPMQNENVYTNNWTGPFYGFERVIETFEMTETPHRFKPINIYYHVYAASKPASLNALKKVYQYALAQAVTPVYASEYIRKVLDFEAMVLARDLRSDEVIVRGDGSLRTLRLDADGRLPDLRTSGGVAGFAAGPQAHYLTLAGTETRLSFRASESATVAAPMAYLADANGRVSALRRDADAIEFTLSSHMAPTFRLAQADRCTVTINGKPARPADKASAASGISLQRYDTDPAGLGRAPHQQVVRVRCLQ